VLVASIVGRLPIGVTGLSILLLVQAATGSYQKGGAVASAYVVGLACFAPLLGRLIDRSGPRGVLVWSACAFPATLLAMLASVQLQAPLEFSMFCAFGAGTSFPPITVCMRTFFRRRLAEESLLATAYSLESVLIELIFILGPLVVALFVALASPAMAVYFAAGSGCIGAFLFIRSSALRTWRIEERTVSHLLGPLRDGRFVALIAVVLCFSAAFGFLEIGATAYATERESPALAGLLLGLMSVGSALGGLAYGSRSWRFALVPQFSLLLGLMGLGLALLSLAAHPAAFAALGVAAGVVMAPVLIVQSMLVAKSVRAEHTAEAFTWSASALLAGVGIGVGAGGALLEVYRSSAALMAAGASALLAALLARVMLRNP